VQSAVSRYVVGWLIAQSESGRLAQRLIPDRGGPMISKRPRPARRPRRREEPRPASRLERQSVFGIALQNAQVPAGFSGAVRITGACREHLPGALPWYNDEHHHSGISFLTPAVVHYGRTDDVLDARHRTRLAAYAAHPERFINGAPRREQLPAAVWINPPATTTHQDAPRSTIVRPDDPEVVPIFSSYESLASSLAATSSVEVAL
jgi:putative transposase